MSFLSRLKNKVLGKDNQKEYLSGFKKTSDSLSKSAANLEKTFRKVDEDFLEQLMIMLLESDIGYETADKIVSELRQYDKEYIIASFSRVMEFVVESMANIYGQDEDQFSFINNDGIKVILLVGVNGSGKTTSAAKLMAKYKDEGHKVAAVAADTFRAGAIEQLAKWGERLDVPVIKGIENGDPSAAIVDGARYAKDNAIDILIIDTAGRLQNKKNLMIELEKMKRVLQREIPGAPSAVWLVIDSTTGQNGISQAAVFLEATDVTGIILSKMDGTAKGGIIIAIKNTLNLPVVFVGVGERTEDLIPFDIDSYLNSIAVGLENVRK
ncbi:MAG: signal recognition particle-docking protein FtsY [Erysipelothrix sp.]|nr:signal recognition particle-docking protein FtsY [Erysipelothrix sp.]